MPRIKLIMPAKYQFRASIPVRIVDVNYAGHLGNDTLLSILHEARLQYLGSIGCSEFEACGEGIIMADAALLYWSEAFYGDTLDIDMAAAYFTRYGFDLYYLVTATRPNGKEVIAHAKTLLMFFNYPAHKKAEVPAEFRGKIDAMPLRTG